MNAKKCDRCGKLYERYNHRIIGYCTVESRFNAFRLVREENEVYNGDVFDLCPECAKSLKSWLEPLCEVKPDES